MLRFVSYNVNKEKNCIFMCIVYSKQNIQTKRKKKSTRFVLQAKKSSANEIQSIKIVTNKKLFSFEKWDHYENQYISSFFLLSNGIKSTVSAKNMPN